VGWDDQAEQKATAVSCKYTAKVVMLLLCRRIARASGRVVAVKALSYLHQIDFPFLLENEVKGLAYANLRNVPRVVRFEELIVLPHGDARVVME